MPPEILGPYGLLFGLIIAVTYIARLLLAFVREYIADLRAQILQERDEGAAWKALAQASERDIARLTAVVEPLLHVKVPPQ